MGANEGAGCLQAGWGLGVGPGGKGVGGPRGRLQEGQGSTGGQRKLLAGGQQPGGTMGGVPRSWGGSSMSGKEGGSGEDCWGCQGGEGGSSVEVQIP